jgi:MFS transporter, DHA2 family, multidrug resistance protein
MRPGDPAFVSRVNALTSFFAGTGRGPDPNDMAQAAIYQQLNQQAAAMAYQTSTDYSVGWRRAWWRAPSF